ncbi:hypothetical protein LJR009_003802 [Bosea sp. LjRoot9]|uniref:hypothetical protein n=1 Tax=Bosea sp. LjRoot9 TaxID=3342341 RepID=UPI003ED16FE6
MRRVIAAAGMLSLALLATGCVQQSRQRVIVASPEPGRGAAITKRITPDGVGGLFLPDGSRVEVDRAGGFTLPNGDYVRRDASGALNLPNGSRCLPDGQGGFGCP